jgi:hypothetical protein
MRWGKRMWLPKPLVRQGTLWILCVSLGAGCAPTGPRRDVSGTVTFQGQRLKIGRIQFLNDRGPAGGAVIRDGTFRLTGDQGLEPGRYRVWISVTEPLPELQKPEESAPPTRELIPEEFNSRSTVTIEVTDRSPNEFAFTIPNPAPKP